MYIHNSLFYKMKKRYDVVIIGGGPAGIISGLTARKYYPKKSILLIKDIEKSVIPCGIPYMFTTLKNPEDNAMGNASLEKNNIDLKVDEVIRIDRKDKKIQTKDKECFVYKKLIFATGSSPILPNIKGIDKKGVYVIEKEMNYLKELKKEIKKYCNYWGGIYWHRVCR